MDKIELRVAETCSWCKFALFKTHSSFYGSGKSEKVAKAVTNGGHKLAWLGT